MRFIDIVREFRERLTVPQTDDPRKMFGVATERVGRGEYFIAAKAAKAAYALAKDQGWEFPIRERLLFPQCLSQAGKRRDAWKDLERLLLDTLSGDTQRWRDHCDIYAEMCSQSKDVKPPEALTYGVFSLLCKWNCICIESGDKEFFKLITSPDKVSLQLEDVLLSIHREDLLGELFALIFPVVERMPISDFGDIAMEINRLLSMKPYPPAARSQPVTRSVATDALPWVASWESLSTATNHAKKGEYDMAISSLRKIFAEMKRAGFPAALEDRLRVPKYLQKAGRGDEAWREYNWLIVEYGIAGAQKHFKLSKIHDAMRLHLQREGNNALAVCHASMSHLYHIQGLRGDSSSKAAAREYGSPDFISEKMLPHLKKAGALNASGNICSIIAESIAQGQNADVAQMAMDIGRVLRENT